MSRESWIVAKKGWDAQVPWNYSHEDQKKKNHSAAEEGAQTIALSPRLRTASAEKPCFDETHER